MAAKPESVICATRPARSAVPSPSRSKSTKSPTAGVWDCAGSKASAQDVTQPPQSLSGGTPSTPA